jgi:hypothetical protein
MRRGLVFPVGIKPGFTNDEDLLWPPICLKAPFFVTMALQLVTILLENIPHFPFYYRSIRLGAALLSIISCMSCHFTFKETSAFSFLKIMPNWSATTSIWIANAAFTFELYAHYPYLGIQTDVGN